MEETILKLLTGNPDPWQVFVGIVILALAVIPRLIVLRDSWIGYRHNRGQVQQHKQALELLKLQYEIEALRKTHDLQEIILEDSALDKKERAKARDIHPSPFWLLLVKFPVVGEILIRLLQGITGLYLLIFGLSSLVMPFVFFFGDGIELSPDEEMNPLYMAIGWLFYIILTYLLFRGYRKIKQWVNDLRSDARHRKISKQ